MLSRFCALFVCCLVFSVIHVAVTEDELECGPNEVYHHCVNCPFEDSCYDRGQILCPAAFLPCFPSCLCKEGFIRKTSGTECVPKEECECGPNEVYHHCVHCPFEDSCYDRGQILCPAAFLPCSPRCLCKEGFIRKTSGTECIPKEECGAPCDVFELYTECKQCANETCSSMVNPKKSNCASEEACTPGCACYHPYYRTDDNSPCLPSCSCPEIKDSPDCVEYYTPITG